MNIAKIQTDQARWYHPSTGRFLSEDPIGFRGGDLNLYRYVENNPLIFNDGFGYSTKQGLAGGTCMYIGYKVFTSAAKNTALNNVARFGFYVGGSAAFGSGAFLVITAFMPSSLGADADDVSKESIIRNNNNCTISKKPINRCENDK